MRQRSRSGIWRVARLGVSMVAALTVVGATSLVLSSPAGAVTTLFVGPGGGTGNCFSPAFTSIQAAVTAAAGADDVISVCPGTYHEQVTVSGFASGLTIVGAGAAGSVLEPTALTCDPTATNDVANNSNYVATALFVESSSDVIVEDLGVDGSDITNADITCTQSTSPEFWGIRYDDASGTVSAVAVSGVSEVQGGVDGDALVAEDGSAVTVASSSFDTFGKNGIACIQADTTCDITENTVTGAGPDPAEAQNGILFLWGGTGTASGNTVQDFNFGSIADSAVGLEIIESSDVTLSDNSVIDDQVGIALESFGATTGSAMTGEVISDNTISYSSNDAAGNQSDETVGIDVVTFPGYEGSNTASVDATVDDNLVDGPGTYSGSPVFDTTPNGLQVGDAGTGNSGTYPDYTTGAVDVTAEGNVFENWSTDVEIVGGEVGASTANVLYNEFIDAQVGVNNASGASNDTTAIVPDVADNWWGCAGGPGAIGCTTATGSLTVAPWLATLAVTPASQAGSLNVNSTVTATLKDSNGNTVIGAPLDVEFSTNPATGSGVVPLSSGAASFVFTDSVAQPVTVLAVVTFGPEEDLVASTLEGSATVTFGSAPIQIFGVDAIGTAIAVSEAEFPRAGSAGGVVLARDDFFSDALAGGPLAAQIGGPLLLTEGADESSVLDPRVQAEIQRVLPVGGTVYILGGVDALSPNVDTALEALGYVVVREAGIDLYATAVDVAEAMGNPSTIFEATGASFFDALSAVPAAIKEHAAILLTDGSTQSAETAAYLAQFPGDTRYAIGGTQAAAGADPTAIPVYGADLFNTSAAVATTFFPHPSIFGVATSADYPDALGGGVFMATGGRMGPLLLVNPNLPVPPEIVPYLNSLAPGTQAYVFGGIDAISAAVVAAVQAAIG